MIILSVLINVICCVEHKAFLFCRVDSNRLLLPSHTWKKCISKSMSKYCLRFASFIDSCLTHAINANRAWRQLLSFIQTKNDHRTFIRARKMFDDSNWHHRLSGNFYESSHSGHYRFFFFHVAHAWKLIIQETLGCFRPLGLILICVITWQKVANFFFFGGGG